MRDTEENFNQAIAGIYRGQHKEIEIETDNSFFAAGRKGLPPEPTEKKETQDIDKLEGIDIDQ